MYTPMHVYVYIYIERGVYICVYIYIYIERERESESEWDMLSGWANPADHLKHYCIVHAQGCNADLRRMFRQQFVSKRAASAGFQQIPLSSRSDAKDRSRSKACELHLCVVKV